MNFIKLSCFVVMPLFLEICTVCLLIDSFVTHEVVAQIASADKKLVSFVKALLGARDTLLEEMQRLSKAIGQTIDLSEFVSSMDGTLLSDSASTGKSVEVEGSGQGKQQNNLEVLALLYCSVFFIYYFV